MQTLEKSGYLRIDQILKLIPIGKSTWWAGVKSGRFPPGYKAGPNTTMWKASDIEALLTKFENEGHV
jgi:predicted DNA-binding transcriptional regulator AlpA